MRRYLLVAASIAGLVLATFALVEALEVPLLTDPRPWLQGGVAAMLLGVGLLVADVVLPVPSSIVMVSHGALFGFLGGAALSVLGSTGAAALAFWLGRKGSTTLTRIVPPHERARADRLLDRWGVLAVVASRPVPVLAETVALLAGASPLRGTKVIGAAALGSLPAAALYAAAGAAAIEAPSTALAFLLVLVLAGATWAGGVALGRRAGRTDPSPSVRAGAR